MKTISDDGSKLTINNGVQFQNWSQRLNKYELKTPAGLTLCNAHSLCNVTSYIHTSEILGWHFPKGKYDRPPDNFAAFMVESREVNELYEKKFSAIYEDWELLKEGRFNSKKFNSAAEAKAGVYSPMELHELLSYGFNLWVQCEDASKFVTEANILKDIVKELVLNERPVVASCTVVGFGHVVSLVGVEYDLNDVESYYTMGAHMKTRDIVRAKSFKKASSSETENCMQQFLWDACNPTDGCAIYPSSIIIDDPYGQQPSSRNNLPKYSADSSGNDNFIDYRKDFVPKYKSLGNTSIKWAHFFKTGARTN